MYCNTAKLCGKIGDALALMFPGKVAVSHKNGSAKDQGSETQKQKDFEMQKQLGEFLDGKMPLLVSTSGTSCGINLPNVVGVCNAEMPGTLEKVMQTGGRAARMEGFTGALHGGRCHTIYTLDDGRLLLNLKAQAACIGGGGIEQKVQGLQETKKFQGSMLAGGASLV